MTTEVQRNAENLANLSCSDALRIAAEEAFTAFPEALNGMIVASRDKILWLCPFAGEIFAASDTVADGILRKVDGYFLDPVHATIGGFAWHFTITVPPDEVNDDGICSWAFNVIALNLNPAREAALHELGYLPAALPATAHALFTFEHELGHCLVDGAMGTAVPRHRRENAANSYALLRHQQRFGAAEGLISEVCHSAAQRIIFSDAPRSCDYYNVTVFEKIGHISPETLAAMTPQDTRDTAAVLARDYSLPGVILDKIHAAYAPVREMTKKFADRGLGARVKWVCDVMRHHADDHDIYRAGKYYIAHHLAQPYFAASAGKPVWSEMMDWMARHEASTGMILNAADAMDKSRPPRKSAPAPNP